MFRSLLLPVILAAPALVQPALVQPALVQPALVQPALAQSSAKPFAPDLSKADANFVAPYSQEGGVASPIKVDTIKNGVRMTALAGGSMGVKLNVPPFDADQLTRLSFDFTRSPDAKVNLFFRVNGRYFAVLLFGPPQVRAGTPIIYDAGAGRQSGRIEIPLRAALRAQMPDADSLKVDEVLAGNWNNAGYLLAGIGGNGPGAFWTISNFKLTRPDVKPSFGPGRWEGQELVIPAKDLDSLSWKGLHSRIDATNNQIEGGANFDPKRGFVFDAAEQSEMSGGTMFGGNFALKDGQIIKYELLGEGGVVVTQGSAPFHFVSLPSPQPPRLRLSTPKDQDAGWMDFETLAMRANVSPGPSTALERDNANPYSGSFSAQLTNTRLASPFDIRLGSEIDVAARPVLTFAYKCDDRLRVDLNLTWNNAPYSIRFTDSDNPNPRLGDVGAVRDGQWHLATFDLLAALKKAKPGATEFKIQNLQFSDSGWPGNVKGLSWWLDDFKWAPATTGKLEGEVVLLDASGTQAVSYALDQSAATSIESKALGGPKLSLDLAGKTGLWWLHLRAQNGAGKWSEAAHYPLWCG